MRRWAGCSYVACVYGMCGRGAAEDVEGEEEQAGSGNAGLDTIIVILQDLAAYELQACALRLCAQPIVLRRQD